MFVAALAILILLALEKTDAVGKGIGFGLAGFCVLLGVYHLWRGRRTSPSSHISVFTEQRKAASQREALNKCRQS